MPWNTPLHTPLTWLSCCFTKTSAVSFLRVGSQIACPYIKRGGCKGGIAERHRTATQQDEIEHAVGALGVIDKLRRQPGRVINKQADNN